MEDRHMDAAYQPNRRPQSTLARTFSDHLDNAFSISGGLEDLSASIDKKQQSVQTQNRELEALEAKLREMEERLEEQRRKRGTAPQQTHSISQQMPSSSSISRNSPHGRRKLDHDLFQKQSEDERPLQLGSGSDESYPEGGPSGTTA